MGSGRKNSVAPDGGSKGQEEKPDYDTPAGPIQNRRCRDIPMLIIFLAFWCGMAYIAGQSFHMGDPARLLYGYDSYGNICGKSNNGRFVNVTGSIPGVTNADLSDRKYLLFFDATSSSALQICVKACPSTSGVPSLALAQQLGLCRYDFDYSQFNSGTFLGQLGSTGPCPALIYTSMSVVHRCLPKIIDSSDVAAIAQSNGIVSLTDAKKVVQTVLSDVGTAWKEMLYSVAICVVVGMLFVLLMRFFAPLLIWATVLAVVVGSAGLTAFLFFEYKDSKKTLDALEEANQTSEQKRNVKMFLGLAITAAIVTVILLLLLLILRKRIKLCIMIFREASKAIAKMPLVMLAPIFTFCALLLFIAYWIFVYMYLASAGVPSLDPTTGMVSYTMDKSLEYMQWYHIFGGLWTANLFIAIQQCTIAGGIATYYWTRDKSKSATLPVFRAFLRSITYHLGSLAFGALIIAIVQMMRIILGYIQWKLKGKETKVVKFILGCLACCLWCLEKFLKFLNRNAYIEIAVYGYSFCGAAQKAFWLLFRNAARVAVINSIGDFCLFLGKVAIAASAGLVSMAFLHGKSDLTYWAVPVFLVTVFGFFVGHCFMSTFEMAVDTIFLCFCEDCERNDGSDEKPYYMPLDMMHLADSDAAERIEKGEKKKKRKKKKNSDGDKDGTVSVEA
eukprot:Opistho-2@47043